MPPKSAAADPVAVPEPSVEIKVSTLTKLAPYLLPLVAFLAGGGAGTIAAPTVTEAAGLGGVTEEQVRAIVQQEVGPAVASALAEKLPPMMEAERTLLMREINIALREAMLAQPPPPGGTQQKAEGYPTP